MLEPSYQALEPVILRFLNGTSPLQVLGFLFGLYVVRRVLAIASVFYNRPTNLHLQGSPFSIEKWWQNLDFIFYGPTRILEGYSKYSKNASFGIPALEEYQVLACTKADIKEVCNSKEDVLSFHVAMTDRMQQKYTMYGFEYGEPDPNDNVPTRAIKVLFRMQLPMLRPLIMKKVQYAIEQEVLHGLTNDGKIPIRHHIDRFLGLLGSQLLGWPSVSTIKFTKAVIEEVNAQIILGEKLSTNSECIEASVRYSHDAVIAAELSRQFPRFMIPLVASGFMAWSGAMKKVALFITTVVEERLAEEKAGLSPSKTHIDCIQWIIDSSQTPGQRATPRLVATIIGILLASSHQLSMFLAYIIYNLCLYPEYLAPLREEIAAGTETNAKDPFKEMHLLDGFLLETARLNPLDACKKIPEWNLAHVQMQQGQHFSRCSNLFGPDLVAVQRKVLKPTRLPSGAYIPPGNLVAIPQQAAFQDPERFTDPLKFNPRRFRPQTQDEKNASKRFTDVSYDYLHWGSPRRACPGRWYASHTLKQAIVHLVTEYDMKLEAPDSSRSFFWTTAIVPRPSTRFLIKRRELKG